MFYVEVLASFWGVPYSWAVFIKDRGFIAQFNDEEEAHDFAKHHNDVWNDIIDYGVWP